MLGSLVPLRSSVGDPDVFGPSGSGSISKRYGSALDPAPSLFHTGVVRTERSLAK